MTGHFEFFSDGDRCAAWWFRSVGGGSPRATVVMAHGFAGVRGLRLDAFAHRFARAGFDAIVFDYRRFGDSEGQPRQVLDIADQLDDWRAAVVAVRALPEVDPDRIVLWGTSLAGGHVLRRAARDRRIGAVIAQVPHVSGFATARAAGAATGLRLGVEAVRDIVGSRFGCAPRMIASIGRPGELAAMSSPDAHRGFERLVCESGTRPAGEVAARVILQMARYSPGRQASAIACPVLIQVVSDDNITPARAAVKAAGRADDVTLHRYPGGHFDPYVDPLFGGVVADQLAFLHHVFG